MKNSCFLIKMAEYRSNRGVFCTLFLFSRFSDVIQDKKASRINYIPVVKSF